MVIKIYGASDDLIEIEGDIEDEFNVYPDEDEKLYLAFSSGLLIKVNYDGEWTFSVVREGMNCITRIQPIPDGEYSQTIEIDSPDVHWIVTTKEIARRKF